VEKTDELLDALKDFKDWEDSLGLGIVALGLATGCRPKEIRMAHLEDLDLKRGIFYLRHPKGEGSWASPQWISNVREDLAPFLRQYLLARETHLTSKGVKEHHALFPAVGYGNRTGIYTASNLNRIKRNLEERTGVEFRIKNLRPNMAIQTVDMDPTLLNDVSSQLRHESPKTTSRYYAEIKVDKAGERLRKAWASN
jgi:integrase/recombinase XerD